MSARALVLQAGLQTAWNYTYILYIIYAYRRFIRFFWNPGPFYYVIFIFKHELIHKRRFLSCLEIELKT